MWLQRGRDLGAPDEAASFMAAMDDLLNQADGRLRVVQDKELRLYVTGPTTMWRRMRPR